MKKTLRHPGWLCLVAALCAEVLSTGCVGSDARPTAHPVSAPARLPDTRCPAIRSHALPLKPPSAAILSTSTPPIPLQGSPRGTPELEGVGSWIGSSLRPEVWARHLALLGSRVGEVRIHEGRGTAFLVGPDLVLTNHHVVSKVLSGLVDPEQVEIHFERPGGPAEVYRLAARGWLVAHSPPSPVDRIPDPKPSQATAAELDYALLRLDGAPGRARGFIGIPTERAELAPGAPLVIVQRALGRPLEVAAEREGVLGVNGPRTRMRYRNHTLGGASGSPVFDRDLRLVALHRGSDPGEAPAYNEGIPISTLAENLPLVAREALGLGCPPAGAGWLVALADGGPTVAVGGADRATSAQSGGRR